MSRSHNRDTQDKAPVDKPLSNTPNTWETALIAMLAIAAAAAAFIFAGPILLPLLAGVGVSAAVGTAVVAGGAALVTAAIGTATVPRVGNALFKDNRKAERAVKETKAEITKKRNETQSTERSGAKLESITTEKNLDALTKQLGKKDLGTNSDKLASRVDKIKGMIDGIKFDHIGKLVDKLGSKFGDFDAKRIATDLNKLNAAVTKLDGVNPMNLSTADQAKLQTAKDALQKKYDTVLDKVADLDGTKRNALQTEMKSLMGKSGVVPGFRTQNEPPTPIKDALEGNTRETVSLENQLKDAKTKYTSQGTEEAQNKLVESFVEKYNSKKPEATPEEEMTKEKVQEFITTKIEANAQEFGEKDAKAVTYMQLEAKLEELGGKQETKDVRTEKETGKAQHDATIKALKGLNQVKVSNAGANKKPPTEQNQDKSKEGPALF
jgi:hypothetical protein